MSKNMSTTKTSSKKQKCIVYSRVVGWLTPTKNFNKGAYAQYKDRQTYKV